MYKCSSFPSSYVPCMDSGDEIISTKSTEIVVQGMSRTLSTRYV